jgi:hypothetical protein
LVSIGENPLVVANGQTLPNGLLFNVHVYTLRENIFVRGDELRKTESEPKHVFTLSGRTDLIVLKAGTTNALRMNTRYVIAVKVKGFKVNEGLKEAYLQLLGMNIDNNNTSPPALLTDLCDKHYVL